jgi:DNA-directed RNA polymerase specialized sigma24 family protein
MSIAEVARCLDVNENTVKTRLFRARAHLSTALSAHRQCP